MGRMLAQKSRYDRIRTKPRYLRHNLNRKYVIVNRSVSFPAFERNNRVWNTSWYYLGFCVTLAQLYLPFQLLKDKVAVLKTKKYREVLMSFLCYGNRVKNK